MVQVTVDMDVSEIVQDLNPEKVREWSSKTVSYSAQELVRVLMRNSPVDHGVLKSWFIESIDETEAHIKTPAKYAEYVNYGTRPHFIYPTHKKALYWAGAKHPVHRVVHPGTAPTLFVENSIDEARLRFDEFALKALSEVLG